jgi:hypothetical protein
MKAALARTRRPSQQAILLFEMSSHRETVLHMATTKS